MNRLIASLLALAALALVVAGCGDSDDSTTDSAPTKAEFVEQGNMICKAGNEEIEAEFEKFAEENGISEKKPPTDEQFEEAAEDFLVPLVRRQVDEVAELSPPEGEEEAFATFLENAEAELDEVEEDPSLLSGDAFEKVNAEARALGLTVCGEE